jgi:hypothetical protein
MRLAPYALCLLQFYSDFVLTGVDPVILKIGFCDYGNGFFAGIGFNRFMQAR